MKRLGSWLGVGLCALTLFAVPSRAQTPRVYVAQYAEVPPVIDGVETTPEEWAGASPAADQWLLLTSGSADTTNNRFEVLWHDTGLYVRHQVDFDGWATRGVNLYDPGYENLNLYFDPNTDGEPNENTAGFGATSIDGYQLAFNQPLGVSEINPLTQTAGSFSEAHVNALFGNQGAPFSGFAGLEMMQTTSVEDSFGYSEMFIPWNNFDATDPADGFNPLVQDIGLYHPEAPEEGEEWYFNVARVQTNGRLPTWESPSGAFFLSDRPHGILQFAARPNSNPCDLNGDSFCDALDIDAISTALLAGSTDSKFDINADGTVEDADRVHYVEVVLNTWIGDSDLDGEFGTGDLVSIFIAGEYEDGIPRNSGWAAGDWNGDLDFTSNDFVASFIGGGYLLGPRAAVAVSAVPEPSSGLLGLFVIVPVLLRRRA